MVAGAWKPLNLARQSFIKTFTHGYAQSLVAASQSSSASQNTGFNLTGNVANLFGRPAPSAASQASHSQHAANASASVPHPTKASGSDATSSDGGLAAYYAAWQRHRKSEESEPYQFQFAKRIGWKPPTTIPESRQPTAAVDAEPSSQPQPAQRPTVTRAKSTNDLDAHVKSAVTEPVLSSVAQDLATADEVLNTPSAGRASPVTRASPSVEANEDALRSPSPFESTIATSVTDSDAYTSKLTLLAEQQQYGDIPALFQSMLASGVCPTSSAYNALLLAAINLPHGRHQVVSRVMDVYADMINRRVAPDTTTYAIAIELLAARALDVAAMKQELAERKVRYGGMDDSNGFLLRSDETESKILAEDDSLSLAIKLFDTSAAVKTSHVFSDETYRSLISACAEAGRVSDMIRVYAGMEAGNVTASSAIYAPMITAFAANGDLRSAIECYDVYKGLAISHDNGQISITRKDDEVYAAVIRAYAICGRMNDGLKFLGKIEDSLDVSAMPAIREAVALRALMPTWISAGRFDTAYEYATEKLESHAQASALYSISIEAANTNNASVATKAFSALLDSAASPAVGEPAMALLAMHIRQGNAHAAADAWDVVKAQTVSAATIEPAVMFALPLISNSSAAVALREIRSIFSRIRKLEQEPTVELTDRMEEAIEVLSGSLLRASMPSFDESLQLLRIMDENQTVSKSVLEHLLAGIGPDHIAETTAEDAVFLLDLQAGIIVEGPSQDVGHAPRFAHLVDVVATSGLPIEGSMIRLIEQASAKIGRSDVAFQAPAPLASPIQAPAEENFDPYASTTDFKGSSMIVDELEKPYGRHSQHLNDALSRFRNMRRAGRHPRYATYAKLITAAAKEYKLTLAEELLAMAKQDVPFVAHNRVVRHGWVSILDSMVAACLSVGRRDMAVNYHQELTNMGAAPSANTFGLYITTMKESTKTFDEATEAVKIFHRAKTEGVEASSFLYNALIGKLGKARRIDDCLFYFGEMRGLGIRPTSVTYGTIVNALCRVSDDKFAEELFEEMESMSNYKPRPAPYNSLMQYFLTTKRDRSKVLAYYERMKASNITPTMHTYKLLVDTHATLEPINMEAAEAVINEMQRAGLKPEAVHFAALIHAKGCVQHDMAAARATFDKVLADGHVAPAACLYQALFESYVANHDVRATEPLLGLMKKQGVTMTAYIANTLIHGWATAGEVTRARSIFGSLGHDQREPSTYEAMIRANLAAEEHAQAMKVVGEALRRGYPTAVADKLASLVGGGQA